MHFDPGLEGLASRITAAPSKGARRIVALAGAPASGKSTLAEALAEHLSANGFPARMVPMDGFHLDNLVLSARGLLSRKGAPETFDLAGFQTLVRRLSEGGEVIFPVFDRSREIAIAGAGVVPADCETVILEGNYLLLDEPGWRDLSTLWDLSVRVDADLKTLRSRLLDRWSGYGLSFDEATEKAEGNDIPNAERVLSNALPADIVCTTAPAQEQRQAEEASR
ncbi:nucleoside triphosphate hydrolase [Sulfitobacter sp. D35]|uniref:nucleoside triphosphate hydrolase n=1 Tax=Sulfitobacter sp. D35 TaxID=3083252 RepID=UPI00296F0DAD|nr:nucleoside triphosphate hydrolase [Sulfitobacter sp. D35]MDW4498944.1 nucleoside triphosphate hydrolase [Sulfitobacter sp. D35]